MHSIELTPRFPKHSVTSLLSAIEMLRWKQVFMLFSQISLHELPHSAEGHRSGLTTSFQFPLQSAIDHSQCHISL